MKVKVQDDFATRTKENVVEVRNAIWEFLCGVKAFTWEYSDNSNIHGLRYLTQKQDHWSERLFWGSFLSVSFVLCVKFIGNAWEQWNEYPVTLSYDERELPISTIPFPTVTICHESKTIKLGPDLIEVYETLLDARMNNTLNGKNLVLFNYLSLMCTSLPEKYHFEKKRNLDKYVDESIYDVMTELGFTSNETMFECSWQSKKINCSEYVFPILTEEGLCYTFNALNSDQMYTKYMAPGLMNVKNNRKIAHWHFQNGYDDDEGDREYPLRVVDTGRGASFGISLYLNEEDFENQCRGYDQGYRVILTPPGESLKLQRHTYRLLIGEDTTITIYPRITLTAKGLRSYDPNIRKCFYLHERSLKFFKRYSQASCEDECLANFTSYMCGCVRFNHPRDIHTKVCGSGNIACYLDAETKFSMSLDPDTFRQQCNCKPTCTHYEYQADMDRIKFDILGMNTSGNDFESSTKNARLAVFFGEINMETIKRVEVSTYSDFLAVIGGLMGLFLGVSALSAIEFTYYGTLRWYLSTKRERDQNMFVQIEDQKVVSTIPFNYVQHPYLE